MKENSIKEDINYLNSMVKEYKQFGNLYNEEYEDEDRIYQALEHILSDYKRVLKENEELSLKYYMLYTEKIENLKAQEVKIKSQVIPVQKVKDKIEELQKEYNKLDKQVDEYIKSVEKDVSTYYENKERISIMQTLSYFIDTLQELIEGRKENESN